MAFVFVQLGRRDLAVRFYDELQMTMAERGEYGSGTFCVEAGADSAMGVTDPDAKEYRRLLVDNTITEIDIRTYLFARQLSLLLTDRKYSDVAERGLKFITALARRCAEEAVSVNGQTSAVFRDTWVFTTARALASSLTPAIPSPTEADESGSVQLGTARERHTARLIAGFHVHALKAFQGLAHVALPGCFAPQDPLNDRDLSDIAEEAKSTSNERLHSALTDPRKAEVLYSEIANAAASLYEMGGRARGAAALDGDAGRVCLRNDNFMAAEPLLSAQCSRFANDNGWDDLHRRQRIDLSQAEKELDHVQEYLVSCLAMLYMSRSARKAWRKQNLCGDDENALQKDAMYWVTEATIAAGRLPRVMKYRADKLFDISVLPNTNMWLEGNPGEAIVQIKSDIPADVNLHSVMLECRCTTKMASTRQASALQDKESLEGLESPQEAGLRQLERKSATVVDSVSVSHHNHISDQYGVLVLRSKGAAVIRPGLNSILVQSSEIPLPGRYKVALIALFIGNLKLVQITNRTSAIPVVTTRGSVSSRAAALAAPPSLQPEYGNGDLKFPTFYASSRTPSAFVSVEPHRQLYLAPRSEQSIEAYVTSGKYGIRRGATLLCSITCGDRADADPKSEFVRLADPSEIQAVRSSEETQRHASTVVETFERTNGIREITMNKDLQVGETFCLKLNVFLFEDCDQLRTQDLNGRKATLRIELTCHEKNSISQRQFICTSEQILNFVLPMAISAHIDFNAEWAAEDVSSAIALDGTTLVDGGSLLCAIESKTRSEDNIILKSVELQMPKSFELRPDEPPAHLDLLPCVLGSASIFTAVFDIFLREERLNTRENYVKDGGTAAFAKDAISKRLSRARAHNSEIAESIDDLSEWSNIGQLKNEVLEPEIVSETPVSTESNTNLESRDDPPVLSEYVGDSALPANGLELPKPELVTDVEDIRLVEAASKDEELCTDDEDKKLADLKVAEDVVDLDTPGVEKQEASAVPLVSSTTVHEERALATLVMKFQIEGLPNTMSIEQRICIEALRRRHGQYYVERSVQNIGECGKVIDLRFAVRIGLHGGFHRAAGALPEDYPSAELLQYEIDADPTLWLVVGRRRGRLCAFRGSETVVRAKIIPLVSGRQRVPWVRLFLEDGRALPFSRYENVNKYMQIVVIPPRTLLSSCRIRQDLEAELRVPATEKGTSHGKGKLPVVIASDSFFES